MKILVINGPNLNALGERQVTLYGTKTLSEINSLLQKKADELGVELVTFQSNQEGALVDFIQENSSKVAGIIINPGALTHYGLSLHDALADISIPVIEVHLSNIYAREEFRQKSVIAPVALGQIAGLGWRGYLVALEILIALIQESDHDKSS